MAIGNSVGFEIKTNEMAICWVHFALPLIIIDLFSETPTTCKIAFIVSNCIVYIKAIDYLVLNHYALYWYVFYRLKKNVSPLTYKMHWARNQKPNAELEINK